MFLEGLLGGITGMGESLTKAQGRDVKAEQDKKDWLRDVMKGLMIQQMKPKSGDFDWDNFVDDPEIIRDTSDLYGPEFFKFIDRIKKGFGRGRTTAPGPAAPRLSPGGINPSGEVITDY